MNEVNQRIGYNSKLRAEAEALLSTPVLQRSPTLSKLLRYLVEETAAGRSDSLKSFVVAVDGLGKSDDFDPASDSSARVQMVRLRRTLETYYAQHGPVDDVCLYLQPGSYTVRLGKLAAAYPALYRPLSEAEPKAGIADIPALTPEARVPYYRRTSFILGGALLGVIAGALMILVWQQIARGQTPQYTPILELMPIDGGNGPELGQTAQLVSSTLADDLPRFKLSRVRLVQKGDVLRQPNDRENVYRLFSRLVADEENGLTLYLNINDARTETLLWAREIALPSGTRATAKALLPVLAEINGPMGVIATHGSTLNKNNNNGGYPCLLKYFSFVQLRDQAIESNVAECFKKPFKEQHIEATILASRAMFSLEQRSAQSDIDAATTQGLAFARAAVAADPNDGSANFALARFSYLKADCVSARFYTKRTMELNPNSPMFTATLAGLASGCNYPEAEKLLDQAFLVQSPAFAKGRLVLIVAALNQGRPEKIADITSSALPQTRYNRINYYLAEALIAASQGNPAATARYWQLFSQTIPPGNRTADEKLRSIIVLPKMRRTVIQYLAEQTVLDNAQ